MYFNETNVRLTIDYIDTLTTILYKKVFDIQVKIQPIHNGQGFQVNYDQLLITRILWFEVRDFQSLQISYNL